MIIFIFILCVFITTASLYGVLLWIAKKHADYEWNRKNQDWQSQKKHWIEQVDATHKTWAQEWQRIREKEADIESKEKDRQAFEKAVRAPYQQKILELEQFLEKYRNKIISDQTEIRSLTLQLNQARQRAKRFAKRSQKEV